MSCSMVFYQWYVLMYVASACAIASASCFCPFFELMYFSSFLFVMNPISVSTAGMCVILSTAKLAVLTPLLCLPMYVYCFSISCANFSAFVPFAFGWMKVSVPCAHPSTAFECMEMKRSAWK